jgi:predicted dehydrogenase
MAKVLICGYGRAGKRHAKLAEDFELEVAVVDPNVDAKPYKQFSTLQEATRHDTYDYYVIATPPDMHIEQIWDGPSCPTLCEKPLCGLGQLPLTKRLKPDQLMFAYNYTYHPAIRPHRNNTERVNGWAIHSENYRPGGIPAWGLLLDHVSHAVSTMSYVTGGITELESATHVGTDEKMASELWLLTGKSKNGDFTISERLWRDKHDRIAELTSNLGVFELTPDTTMFELMWQNFLLGNYEPDLKHALAVQAILQEANDKQVLKENVYE